MLHILLLILKIIGIILICILGILVLGVLGVLFVPVRYRIEAVRQEGEGQPPAVLRVKATWFLHLANFLVRFDGTLSLRVRLAVITVFKLPKEKKKGKAEKTKGERKKRKKKGRTAGSEKEGAPGEEAGKAAEEKQQGEEIIPDRQAEEGTGTDREETRAQMQEAAETDEALEKQPSFFDKLRAIPRILRSIFAKIKSFFANTQYTIQKFCDKIKSVSDKIVYYRDILEGEPFKRSFTLCKDELAVILKSLKPDCFEAQLIVGLDDPAATGEALAVCGMLYPLFGGHVDVAGDFEEKRLEGRVFIKGKLRFFTFLRVAVKLYFNKDIKKLIKLFKKEAV